VASTRNELPLACRTDACFLLPDISGNTTSFFFYIGLGSLAVQEATTTLLILCWRPFYVTMSLSSVLVPMRLLRPLAVRLVVFGKRHFLFRVSSRFWSELRWQNKIIKNSCCSMFRGNIFIES